FKMTSDTVNDDTEGEDSYKFIVNFLPQGELSVYTQAKNAGPVVLSDLSGTAGTLTVGDHAALAATLGGHRATQVVDWSSDDEAVATVSDNGVVTAVGAGTADITATHPAATGAATPIAVTVTV